MEIGVLLNRITFEEQCTAIVPFNQLYCYNGVVENIFTRLFVIAHREEGASASRPSSAKIKVQKIDAVFLADVLI